MSSFDLLEKLPGAELVRQGIRDRLAERFTIESLLVEIARPRLERHGLIPHAPHRLDAEISLYQILAKEFPNPHGRYNSLLRELVSFEHALDHRMSKKPTTHSANPRE